jgi:hypothetical protein
VSFGVWLACLLVGAFMAWRERYLSARKPPALAIYLAGVLGGSAGAFGGRLIVQDSGSMAGEVFVALLFAMGGAGLAVGLVDLASRRRNGPPREAAVG